ncbi:MAG: TonB-dependent receptor [Candidatus Eisenbacteria bacterium]|uniref:TonB-dependent receptor n=1 Tax=Eiseniibacteriota bacterium TaxID=2212470 RepID=A0A933SEK3_UNCEI|nr:TonB-dependent receptor [Candidatus Eisenbacteria bacterium]
MRSPRAFLAASLPLLLLLAVAPLHAATLRGRVVAHDGGAPIAGALVRLAETGASVRTAADGGFTFERLAPGRWTLAVRHVAWSGEARALVLDEPGADLVLALRPAVHPADEVIVESARTSFTLRHAPWPAGVRTTEQLAGRTAVTPAEQAAALPGVALVRDGAWQTNVSIRGMGRASIVSLVDHTRIETAQDLAGALSLVNDADLERIEVMKTPGSVLFGTGALGGAIQLITRRAPFGSATAWSGAWSEGVSSVDEGVAHHASLERSAARTALRLSGSYRDAGLTATPRGDLPNSQYTDWSGNASLGVRTRGEQSLFASWQRSQAEHTGITGGTPIAATATATYRLARRERFALEYLLPHLSRALPMLTLRAAHQDVVRNVEIVQSPTVTVTPHATHRTTNAQVEARLQPSPRHLLTVGAEAWQRVLDSRRERRLSAQDRVIGERPVPHASHTSAGAFAQDDWSPLPDRVRVTLGARADWSRTRNDRTLNPEWVTVAGVPQVPVPGQVELWPANVVHDASWDASAGLHVQATGHVGARVLVASAYRTPSLEERFQFLDLGSSLRVGNPALAPERGLTVNTGVRLEAGGTALDADVFFNSLADRVAEEPGTFEGRAAFVKRNIGRARLYGGELSLEQRLAERVALSASLAQVRGEDLTAHTELAQVAPLSARGAIEADARRAGTWRLECVASRAQRHPGPGETLTAGWTAWNAAWSSAPVALGRARAHLRCGVDNVFDRAYRQHLSTLRGVVKLEPGRNVHASLSVELP